MQKARHGNDSTSNIGPSRTALALFLALGTVPGLTSCARDERPSDEADSSSTSISRATESVIGRSVSAPGASDSPERMQGMHRGQRSISTETLIVTLSHPPTSLRQKKLGDAAWRNWLQETLGEAVQVLSARALDPTQARVPTEGTQVVVTVANTTEENIRQARERAAQASEIKHAEVDPIWSSNSVPNDPLYSQQWHLPKIQAPQAWDIANGSSNVVVAVIDTGIDLTHPDLANAIWTNPYDAPDGVDNDGNGLVDDVHGWNFLGNNSNLTDTTGHGTHVAGLIGAQKNNGVGVAGVASGVKLMPLAVGANAPASAVVSAIYYAATHGANVINMSFGGPETFSGARAAIDYAVARGVLLVASANNWSSEEYNYPAVYQDVVAVAATDPNDQRASLSNYGSWVDIAAPGQDVFSTFPTSSGSYFAISGTSQASPIVAGVAALIKSVHPDWSADQVRTQLLASADDLSSLNPDYVGLLGAGRVNAARAVGATITNPRPFLAGVTTSEITGNGDQQPSAGDTASVAIAWRFTGNATSATARLTSSDPYVTVTAGSVNLASPKADRTQTARFTITIAANTPADRVANLTASVDSGGTTVSAPVRLSVAPAYRRQSLSFAYSQLLLPSGSGKQVLVADDSPLTGQTHRVYAAFRNADGSFGPETTLSDTATNARRPSAYVDTNGDVNVAFYQAVQSQEFAAFPGYAKYTAATGQWSRSTLINNSGIWASTDLGIAGSEQPIAISRAPNGELHMAWGHMGSLVLAKQSGSSWIETQTFDYPSEDLTYPRLDLKFITVASRLKLFVHPIPTRIAIDGPPPDFSRKLQVLEYDGATWSAPVELNGGSAAESAQLPYLKGSEVRRFYEPSGTTAASIATLSGNTWNPLLTVQDIGSVDLHSGFFGLDGTTRVVTFLARPVAATAGSTRELWENGVLRQLTGKTTRRAEYPVIVDNGGTLYVFNQERWLHREHTLWFDYADETSFYTQAALAPAALPSVPVVTDDGSITNDTQHLHARWSSSHSSGIRSYRVAWGTAPGLADIMPWTVTSLSESTFDLGDQRLLPGQTAYLSVIARSNAVLSSAMGVSDGITMANLCTAPSWNSQIAYQDAGTLVTYQGATYRSLYWNSNSVPTTPNGAWQLVAACVGTPVVSSCIQPQWTAGRVYPVGSRVSYNGYEFAAQWASDTVPTGASGNPWKWITNCR